MKLKIFVSWSGRYSREVAELLRDWVPNVIQEATVYVSSQDIAKGEAWPDSVRGKLSEIDLGIVVVTKTNMEAPWILFEAGALSKSVKSRMIPLLCNVDHVDLSKSPLRLFQSSLVTEPDMLAMLQSLNSFAAQPLADDRIAVSFQKWWPDFRVAFENLEPETQKSEKGAKNELAASKLVLDALDALLADVQTIKSQMRDNRQREHLTFASAERAFLENKEREMNRAKNRNALSLSKLKDMYPSSYIDAPDKSSDEI